MARHHQRDKQGHQLTDAFLFQNLVGAYEDVPLAISLQQAASLFDIPASEIRTGSGTLIGDDGNTDLFYLDPSNQVLQGQGGSDAYIVGYNFGHDVIQDVWQGLGQNQEDSIWFAHLNVSDLTFARNGFDLLITQNGTGNEIRVVDEFAGRRPGLVTAFQDFDKQIEIFKFADGTTWDQLDLARAIGMLSYATDDNLIGTPDVDFLNGGAGTDYMSGGDGGDHYFFGRGYGHDTIEDREVWVWGDSPDYVHFGAGITEDDVTFRRVGVSDDLQVTINGTNDVLTVTGQFGVAYGLLDTQQDRIVRLSKPWTALGAKQTFRASAKSPAGHVRTYENRPLFLHSSRMPPVDLERSVAEVLRLLPGLLPECDPQHHRWAKPGGEGDSGMRQ
jgi:hypothetical protein